MAKATVQVGRPSTELMVLLFTDVVGSVAMKNRLGTSAYAELLAHHDELFQSIVSSLPGGEILKDLGDGFLTRFTSTSEAVNAALRFQQALELQEWDPEPIRVRVGLHLGEITEREEDVDGKPKLVGLAADISARLMGLALPGQILMTRAAFDEARQYVREHPKSEASDESLDLRWMAHGPYLFEGADEPMEVCEVGAVGIAPLKPPPDRAKGRRAIQPGEEEMYGWRPAIGRPIPRRDNWLLQRKIGEGGFGEVWLTRHRKTGTHRVFKFCFDADRLRSFKRELTLFRLLREALGDRPDIAKIHDIQLDKPPFYLESDFTEQGNLADWAQVQGGIDQVPLATRLDLLAGACNAVAAAHSIGILHKDLKPSNVLIYETEQGEPRPCLCDFGIGILTDRSQLERYDITLTGFTETVIGGNESSRTGTRIYAPPETLTGQPFTIQGDVYALGVMLYQMVAGDLTRPLGQGWESDIPDPLLRDDIARCVAGRPQERLGSASELAERLRTLEPRRKARRRRNVTKLTLAASVILAVLLTIASGLIVHERDLRRQIETQAAIAQAVNDFLTDDLLAAVVPSAEQGKGKDVLMRDVLDEASTRIEEASIVGGRFEGKPLIEASIRATLGATYWKLGEFAAAEPHMERARMLRRRELGEEHTDTLASMNNLATLYLKQGRYDEAEPLYVKTLEIRKRVLGEEHPDTLVSMNNLALLYLNQGRYDEAEPLYVKTLEIQKRVLGEEHPDTLTFMNNLALVYLNQGRYDEAELLHVKTLEIQKRVLGEEHPSTLRSMSSLALLYSSQGRYDEAEPVYLRTLEIQKRVLGEEHPETLGSMHNLAILYLNQGRYDEAEPLHVKTLQIQKRILGEEHPDTLNSMNNLALLYFNQGRYDEAEPVYLKTLEIQKRVQGEEHPNTIFSINNLADLYHKQGRYDEAATLFAQALAGAREAWPARHWITGAILGGYGKTLTLLQRYEEAEIALLEAHELITAGLGPQNERTAEQIESLVDLYSAWGKLAKAAEWRAKMGEEGTEASRQQGTEEEE